MDTSTVYELDFSFVFSSHKGTPDSEMKSRSPKNLVFYCINFIIPFFFTYMTGYTSKHHLNFRFVSELIQCQNSGTKY